MRTTPWILILLLCLASVASGQIPQHFERMTPPLGIQATVADVTMFDDGAGPKLYAAGSIGYANGMDVTTGPVARFDGIRWSGIDAPLVGTVRALTVFDDGTGSALYVGGDFVGTGSVNGARHLLRWDGSTWSALPGALDGGVSTMLVHDDGSGPALFVGGEFERIDQQVVGNIARWNGLSWSALQDGVGPPVLSPGLVGYEVLCLASFDDGGGRALYVGGRFWKASGQIANNIARWRNGAWSLLGSGLTGFIQTVTTLAVFNGALHAGGGFSTASSGLGGAVARWNGTTWSSAGVLPNPLSPYFVDSMAVHDDGSGAALYVGGSIDPSAPSTRNVLLRFDGAAWSLVDAVLGSNSTDLPRVAVVRSWDLFGAPTLIVGGKFREFGPVEASSIVTLRSGSWSTIGGGLQAGLEAESLYGGVQAFTIDGALGPELVLTGNFSWLGGMPAERIARFDGTTWTPMGRWPGFTVGARTSVVALDRGSGTEIFATVDSGTVGFKRWNGGDWIDVAPVGTSEIIGPLAVFDSGGGPALHAIALSSGSGSEAWLMRWTNTEWIPLAQLGYFMIPPVITDVVVGRDATGPALFIAAQLRYALPSSTAGMVWRFDGAGLTNFPPLEDCNPYGPGCSGSATSLAVFDDGTGPSVYVSGSFNTWNNLNNVARFDGMFWQPLGQGAPSAGRLVVHDDGNGPRLHLLVPGHGLMQWDGITWNLVAGAPSGNGEFVSTFDDGGGRDLILGGNFTLNGGAVEAGIFASRSCLDTHVGERSGVPFRALAIGTPGGLTFARSFVATSTTPFSVNVLAPPMTPAPAHFALFAMAGTPTASTLTALPFGVACVPLPEPGNPTLYFASSLPGVALLSASPAPWSWSTSGLGFPLVVTLQGAILDPTSPLQLSLTNGIVLHVEP